MINFMNNKKGITLMSLAITIIVLLILAGISVATLTGDNGIIKKTGEAKNQADTKGEIEQVKLAVLECDGVINEQTLNRKLSQHSINETVTAGLDEGEYVLRVGNNEYKINQDGNVKYYLIYTETLSNKVNNNDVTVEARIPEGFSISKNEGERSIEKGLVVQDQEGNEYVWIPVFTNEQVGDWGVDYSNVTSGDDWENIEKALKGTTASSNDGYTKGYKNANYSDEWYGNDEYGQYGYYNGSEFVYYTNGNLSQTEYNTLYHNMLKSIYKNGGFYIGRFEMGTAVVSSTVEAQNNTRIRCVEYTPSSVTSGTTQDNTAIVRIGARPVTKANSVPYSYITQSQAEMLAESFRYNNVKSSLLFGVQWDAVCVFIQNYGKVDTSAISGAGDSFNSSYLTNTTYSKLWGNYRNSIFLMNRGFYTTNFSNTTSVTWSDKSTTEKGTATRWLCTTGASEQNKVLNIYDFAGNETEWTLERYNDAESPCTNRGGSIYNDYYARYRASNSSNNTNYLNSARVSLYIK